ncbi:hypothetical protein ACH5RR_008716 [Cinchona calisaya]|uniref:Uncharacterized protein n=1 Tax=Cinchona calisaya TaxID=153742 RepID=A0ABD3ACD4_9GENT
MLSNEGSMKAFSTITLLFKEQICMQNSSPGSRSESSIMLLYPQAYSVELAMVTFKELVTSNQKYLLIVDQDDDTAKNRTQLLIHATIHGNYAGIGLCTIILP